MIKGTSYKKIILISAIVAIFLLDKSFCPSLVRADDSVSSLQDKINSYLDKVRTAQQQLQKSQTNLAKNQVSMMMTKNIITQTQNDITQKEEDINNLEQRIELNRTMLADYIQEAYYSDQEPLANLIATTENMNEMTENFDQVVSVKEKILTVLDEINNDKSDLESAKGDLFVQEQAHEQLLSQQTVQHGQIVSDIQDQQATIQDLQKQISQLQSDLNALLGTAYSTDDIWKAVKFASDETNVPRGFLMGVLQVESHLGANIGKGNWKTDMSPAQQGIFKSLCKSLGYNPDKQPVSRRICYNTKAKDHCGGWGGAMGAEQFIPSTWMAYSSQVSDITGNDPADPWNLDDGITAMALKLSRTPGVTKGSRTALKQAACSYLGTCNAGYISGVLYWADNYKQLLN